MGLPERARREDRDGWTHTQPGEAWHRPPSQPVPSVGVVPHPGQVDTTSWQKRGLGKGWWGGIPEHLMPGGAM